MSQINAIDAATGGSSAVLTISGDTGTATPSSGNINVITDVAANNAGASFEFVASGSTVQLNVTDTNLNTFVGENAGNTTLSGTDNTGFGYIVLQELTLGSNNVSFGAGSLQACTSGSQNVALGKSVMTTLLTGSWNIGIGAESGVNYTGSESSNILINSDGVLGESNTLRIGAGTGTSAQELSSAYISGINGVNVSSSTQTVVTMTSGSDQLGTAVLTAGAGVSITPTANTITIAASAGTLAYTDEATSFNAVANNGYFCTAALTATLPASPSQGQQVTIVALTNSNVVIAANTGQTITLGSTSSTTAGSCTSSVSGNTITLVYRTADTSWRSIYSIGTWVLA